MVGLDTGRGAVLRSFAFDDVGIQSPLGQKVGLTQAGCSLFEHPYELFADDFTFLLRVDDPGKLRKEPLAGIGINQVQAHVTLEGVLHPLGLLQPQQTVVNEDAGQLVTDGLVEQHGGHRGIDPSRQGADHPPVSHLLLDALDRVAYEVPGGPGSPAIAGTHQKVL